MEEVPEEEPQVWGGVLSEEAGVLLQENEEYINTLKRGQVDPPVPKVQKSRAKQKQLQAQIIKEETPNDTKSGRATKGSSTSSSSKKLWDRPIQQQPFDWYFDPQMPREWNEMVSSMMEHENATQCRVENVFRMADPEEILQPQCFKHLY
jgi:hypothetical protein